MTSVYIVLPAGGGEQQSLTPPLSYVLTAAAAAGCYTCVLAVSQVLVDAGEEATLIVACTHTQHCMRVFIRTSTGVFFSLAEMWTMISSKRISFFFGNLGVLHAVECVNICQDDVMLLQGS